MADFDLQYENPSPVDLNPNCPPASFFSQERGVYYIYPGTWVADPLTGEREKIRYRYIGNVPMLCPSCGINSNDIEYIKTQKYLILYCQECQIFTWLKL